MSKDLSCETQLAKHAVAHHQEVGDFLAASFIAYGLIGAEAIRNLLTSLVAFPEHLAPPARIVVELANAEASRAMERPDSLSIHDNPLSCYLI